MSGFSTGRRMKELGLGVSGSLPSDPDYKVVLHGQQTLAALSEILGKQATSADLDRANQLAEKNKNYDTLIKEIYSDSMQRYGEGVKADISNRRMAGTALAGAGGAAGLIALIQYFQSPKIEERP